MFPICSHTPQHAAGNALTAGFNLGHAVEVGKT